jgi:hypothetical protein
MLTIAGGFFCWGAVFPIGLLIDRIAASLIIPGELENYGTRPSSSSLLD